MEDWNKRKLIGNNAENIVEYLINTMPDWKCIKFGVENHIEALKETIRHEINPITLKIRTMPDFVAFNEKTRQIFFIEVKRSYYGIFNFLERYNKYWAGTKLIIVRKTKPHFVYIDLEKIDDSMKEIKRINGQLRDYWEFKEIEQDIKELFPDLKDEAIKVAVNRI